MSIKNRKLQVFVSSTFTDLQEERQKAVESLLSTGHIPAGMELFIATDQTQMEIIKEWIRDSDVYLLILGSRYGSIESLSEKSYTHLEYEYALEIGKPHFAVVISDKGETVKVEKQGKSVLERDYSEKYNQFRKQVIENKLVHFWDDLNGIELAIHKSLARFNKREELVGWVKGDQVTNSGELTEELLRLGKENAELRNQIENLNKLDGGSNFDILFSIINKRRISVEILKKTFPGFYFPDDISEIDGNSALLLIRDHINGIEYVIFRNYFEVLTHFTNFNLITIEERYYNNAERSFPKFTDYGIKYLLYLEKNHPELC